MTKKMKKELAMAISMLQCIENNKWKKDVRQDNIEAGINLTHMYLDNFLNLSKLLPNQNELIQKQ